MNNSEEGNGKVLRKKKDDTKDEKEKPKPPIRKIERKEIKKPESGRIMINKISHDESYFNTDPT
jgi:hypothetical protein